MSTSRITKRILAAAVTLAVGGPVVSAQPLPADPIAVARSQQRVADQKATAEVERAVQDAARLARTNPPRAAQALRAVLLDIDTSGGVSVETRKNLTARLQSKIAAIEGKPDPTAGARPDPTATATKEGRQAVYDAYFAEVKAVREGVDTVKRYLDANQKAEADRVIAQLNAKYPNNPAVLTLTRKESLGDRVGEAQVMAKVYGERFIASQNELTRSAMPAIRDVEFPANWKEKTKNRTNEMKFTAKEKALIEALDKPVTISFNGRPFEEALQDLSNLMDQPLVLDRKSVDDLGVDLKKGATLESKGLSARTVLRQLLGAQGLTFVVKDELIQVVTVEKARDMLVTRVYYMGDLVQGVGPFGGALTWGPLMDYQQTMANVKLVIDSVQGSVDPLSWKERGGPGTVTFHFPSMSLIVRASSEVHATLGSKFGGGK